MMLLWPSLWTAVAQPDRVPQDVSSTCRNLTGDTFEQRKAAAGPDAAIYDFSIYFFSNLISEEKKTKKNPLEIQLVIDDAQADRQRTRLEGEAIWFAP